MTVPTREAELVETFVKLTDTLVRSYDVIDLLHTLVERCAYFLDATDAGILIPDALGRLSVVASTSERGHLIGLLQLSAQEGPCIDAFTSGNLVTVDSIAATYARWPGFATEAAQLGYASTHAIPMRLREETIGSLNLYRDTPGPLNESDASTARALADVATIGILHERSARESNLAREQLQGALDSRILIEQAKGVLAYRDSITVEEAFARLRAESRNTSTPLTVIARAVVDSTRNVSDDHT